MQNTQNSDFRQLLSNELSRRIEESPRYSLRAFARHLEVDSSFLSKILNGKRTVTMRTIKIFGERLNLPQEELQRFGEITREKKMRRKLERILSKVPAADRDHTTISISVNEARITEAKERIQAFRKELVELLADDSESGKNYQVSLSIYPNPGGQ